MPLQLFNTSTWKPVGHGENEARNFDMEVIKLSDHTKSAKTYWPSMVNYFQFVAQKFQMKRKRKLFLIHSFLYSGKHFLFSYFYFWWQIIKFAFFRPTDSDLPNLKKYRYETVSNLVWQVNRLRVKERWFTRSTWLYFGA